MSDLLKTIHANEQIRAAVDERVSACDVEELKREAFIANELAKVTPMSHQRMFFGLAAIKLMELIERKEREVAGQ